MLGKLVGGLIGAKAAKRRGGMKEPGGALMGAAAVAVTRRFGLPGMLAAAAGGYALKRYNRKRARTPYRTK
ncbi:hypothetical protein ABVV53_00550 [Novosphingobium sp. RD2P27]|uniref:Secreted protein with PEP-CTERM sorting signal n=1 Tax=Novosphingobium kalidii TaxID=3230299 RepID=A0ABV2CWI4_9SPHN